MVQRHGGRGAGLGPSEARVGRVEDGEGVLLGPEAEMRLVQRRSRVENHTAARQAIDLADRALRLERGVGRGGRRR